MKGRSSRPRSPIAWRRRTPSSGSTPPSRTDEDIAALGQAFHLHPLTLEDIGHRRQRPRVELFEDYGFITMRPLSLHGDDLTEHEVHAVVGKRFLGTLRYGPDPFPIDEVVKRWQRQPELLASDPGGFAVYVLFDEVVDGVPQHRRAARGHGRRS